MSLCILKLTGKGADGNLQPYHIINPVNVVVNLGVVTRPGKLKDAQNNPISVEVTKTILTIGGSPLIVEETLEEVIKMVSEVGK